MLFDTLNGNRWNSSVFIYICSIGDLLRRVVWKFKTFAGIVENRIGTGLSTVDFTRIYKKDGRRFNERRDKMLVTSDLLEGSTPLTIIMQGSTVCQINAHMRGI